MGLEHKNSALYFFQVEMHSLRAHTIDFFRHRQHTVASSKGLHFRGLWLSRLTGPEVHRSLALATTTRLKTQKERTSAVAKCKAMVVYESEENNIDGNIAKRNKCEAAFVGLL